jgi:hypothetical protein
MASTTHGSGAGYARGTGSSHGGWVTGGTVFAGVLMIVNGVLGVLQGITGIAKNHVYVHTANYVYRFNLTSWGWIHLVIGALLALVGFGVLSGQAWARWVGVGLAGISLIAQFLFLPYYPLWSLVAIAIDVFVIWALATPRSRHGEL